MADNYLENQYEQYQARKAAWEKAKKNEVSKPKIKQSDKLEKPAAKVDEKKSDLNTSK